MMMAIIMFSFGGLELVGITAAEADNPEQSIPKATNQVIYRILIFYVGSLAVLLSCCRGRALPQIPARSC
jgi:aromatic amino acid transport protein AroP